MEIEYMELALKEARKAAARDEVPVGCIIVDPAEGKIVSRAGNAGEKRHCLCHAELVAIEKALKKRGAASLWGLDMYVTLEPCAMCAADISFARIESLYFGAYDEKGGAVENGVRFYESCACHHRPHVEGGVMEQECARILKEFFRARRK